MLRLMFTLIKHQTANKSPTLLRLTSQLKPNAIDYTFTITMPKWFYMQQNNL
ncbi:hypothetical protein [Vibrio vulnificus YJ016]|uniref:Uncharacterized protein n=1 Tax=Vibrio vulnificus (strain YJ016) TaxID=196600 RepID=Q7MF18_VIBVY|nr:hypothetical protein [Vibrio vulnificus YJ016]